MIKYFSVASGEDFVAIRMCSYVSRYAPEIHSKGNRSFFLKVEDKNHLHVFRISKIFLFGNKENKGNKQLIPKVGNDLIGQKEHLFTTLEDAKESVKAKLAECLLLEGK